MMLYENLNQVRKLLGLPPITATAGVDTPGDHYREWEHPRDSNGRWIEKLSAVRIDDIMSGIVSALRRDGSIDVRITHSDNPEQIGTTVTTTNDHLEMIPAKARLDSDITPDLNAPEPGKRPWNPQRPVLTGDIKDLDTSSWAGLMQSLKGRDLIIFDTETTGFDVGAEGVDQPIQIGGVRMRDGKVVDRFNTLVSGGEISEFITNLTGIKPEDTEGAPAPGEAVDAFLRWANLDDNTVLSAHNAEFDLNVIEGVDTAKLGIPTDQPVLDSLSLARALIPKENSPLMNHRLGTLAEFFGVDLSNAHSADADAEATSQIIGRLLQYGAQTRTSTRAIQDQIEQNKQYNLELAEYAEKLRAWKEALAAFKARQSAEEAQKFD